VGAITPALARLLPDGGYELISGHRRLAACQVLGVETMPVIVRELSDDEAVIAMVDANLQRETILPSETVAGDQLIAAVRQQSCQRRGDGSHLADALNHPLHLLVDANLQRETILPSEKAFAYKMKLDALNHQGITSGQVGQKWSREKMADETLDIQLHFVGKRLFAGQDGLPLQIGVHHCDHRFIIRQFPDDDGHRNFWTSWPEVVERKNG